MSQHISSNQTYYDHRFGQLSQQLNEEEKRRWFVLENELKSLDGYNLQIADFGCGRGWLSQQLSTFGKVTGFDLSEKAVENAKNCFPDCAFFVLNAEGILPENFQNQFQLVVSSEVIEHTEAQKEYIGNVADLLNTNGTLVLTTPNGSWKNKFYQKGREQWKQPVENWLNTEQIKNLLLQNNFEIVKIKSFNSEWLFDFRPNVWPISILSFPIVRKLIKALGIYGTLINYLNQKEFGLNLIVVAKKK